MAGPDLTIDPFTQIYNALWDAFTTRASFQALVREGNRIIYTGLAGKTEKTVLQSADAPQLRIVPAGGSARQTSTGWQGPAKYELEAFSGSNQVDQYYYPLKWEIYKALWVQTIANEPLGLSFISKLTIEDVSEGKDDINISGGGQGWFGIVTVVAEIYLDRNRLEE